ncbi:lysophospholipid acyltransferase family protein [Profundibacterium mesophilum]|uniref:1-acyl-sn-glycerol-3-phosphate acyltransferase n=1 Tax=Profundibacterium mesophilum KAUST100406-0324 TaxID=1037889 RepID=A0A921NNQ7_9RHOB|nr:lysophospholipid acyltransferase family protein [Profundibacterium mesophilum]KAF0675186.1 1-acyl-sn-glycerol-3-phosphate acyltransferase [Profundibacterium mesophilum KAUST100406-0324]
MSFTWYSEEMPDEPAIGIAGHARAVRRGLPLALLVTAALSALLAARLAERVALRGARRLTPRIAKWSCRGALWLLGIGHGREGRPAGPPAALVANHSSWLDIFAINAADPVFFVSKAEVASWPGIGPLARAAGTLFIQRDRRQSQKQRDAMIERMRRGDRLLFFPEGTSTDGRRVLPFRTTLFSAFFAPELPDGFKVQPVTVRFTAPPGADPRFYAWWGSMGFGQHLLKVLAAPGQGRVDVIYHEPHAPADFADRKALAAGAEGIVRSGLDAEPS